MHNCQHLFVMDLVVPFHIREAFWHKAYWVEQPIFLLLQQDGSCGEVGCITLQAEEARPRGEGECGGGGDGVLQCVEGLLLSCTPQPVLQLLSECMEGVSNFREVLDEPSVEVHKSYEGLDVLHFHQLWRVCDSLDFNRVHHYMVFGDDKFKVVHLLMFEFAFLWSEEQLVGMEGLEYLLSDPLMVCKGGRVDEDVIHVANSFIAINKGVEDVVHHHLEGSW